MSRMQQLSACQLLDLIQAKRFGAEYQPIIEVKNGNIFAYECLSRFYDPQAKAIPPDIVYASLHKNPLCLFQVEYEQKLLQLENAPDSTDIFVNLDQDSYSASDQSGQDNPFVKLFKNYQKANIIVELIENAQMKDALVSLAMIDNLSNNGIDTAIDDLFDPLSMLSTSVIQLVDFIKIDKYVIQEKHNQLLLPLVKCMIDYAHQTNKKVVLEGVETTQDLYFARQLGVDFVQGFLYRPLFEYIR
ncbi:signal peptide protein [Psychromonas sp. PRT-SC03]|nr:signal peptide protein [Psychromonas sp. PRT-SC03]